MARFLAIDWDHQHLQVVCANLKHGKVRVLKAAAWREERSPNPAEAEALGPLLRERLKSAGIPLAPVLACVGRDRVILKEIRHPPVPPAEEAAVVRFQAVKELNDSPDEVVIDYVPDESAGERKAQALVLRRELLQAYQTLCKAAGLKLAGLCPRPYATARCVPAGAEGVAVLTLADRWAEFAVVRGGRLVLARSLSVEAGEAPLLGEVRRNLAVYANQNPQHPVRELHVADGTEAGTVAQRLADKLAIPVHELDPFAGLDADDLPEGRPGLFAGVAGLLRAQASPGGLPINFVKPREPKPARDPNQLKIAVGIAAACLLLIGGVAYGWSQLSAKDREIRQLAQQRMDLDRQLASLEDDARRIKALGDWTGSSVVWLDELYDLTARFPDLKTMRLTSLSGALETTGQEKGKTQGKVILRGVTSDPKGSQALADRLAQETSYRVRDNNVSRNSTVDQFRFGQQFEIKLDVEPRAPAKYASGLTAQRLPPPLPPRKAGFRPPPPEPKAEPEPKPDPDKPDPDAKDEPKEAKKDDADKDARDGQEDKP